jgi:hypothetical protein
LYAKVVNAAVDDRDHRSASDTLSCARELDFRRRKNEVLIGSVKASMLPRYFPDMR